MSCQRLLLGFDRGGDASPQCFLSSSMARFLASGWCSSSRRSACGARDLPEQRCCFARCCASCLLIGAVRASKWRRNHSSMHGLEIATSISLPPALSIAVGTLGCWSISNTHQILVRRPDRRTALSSPGSSLPPLSGGGPVNERCGHAVEVVHDHAHAGPMYPVPVVVVVDLRPAAFGENDDYR